MCYISSDAGVPAFVKYILFSSLHYLFWNGMIRFKFMRPFTILYILTRLLRPWKFYYGQLDIGIWPQVPLLISLLSYPNNFCPVHLAKIQDKISLLWFESLELWRVGGGELIPIRWYTTSCSFSLLGPPFSTEPLV